MNDFIEKVLKHERNGNSKLIIFSHGFGVRWDSRGLFTELMANIKGFDFICFDYVDTDTKGHTYVKSVLEQKEQYLRALELAKTGNYGEVNILSHSFGIVVPSLVDNKEIFKFIAIAPPPKVSKEKQIEMLMSKNGGNLNINGYTELPRSDGSKTYVDYGFYKSLEGIDIPELFKLNSAKKKSLIIANNDEVVDHDYSAFMNNPEIEIIRLDGNHNFGNEYRVGLVAEIIRLLG